MTDQIGIWEHARYLTRRKEHGYCTDDNARALIVCCRQQDHEPGVDRLSGIYLNFIIGAALESGGFHNRRAGDGSWEDEVGSEDSQGRALWALGTVSRVGSRVGMRDASADMFTRMAGHFESSALRSNAFAMLGAAEVLEQQPDHRGALTLMAAGVGVIGIGGQGGWPWPEPRLAYDNARLPEALIAAGECLGDSGLTDAGLRLLAWLVEIEMRNDRFSFVGANGWAPGEPRPGFDQQPVEAGAMADACFRAWKLTGEPEWRDRLESAVLWFLGRNDSSTRLYDPRTGGCCDGLTAVGANRNQGAESTVSALMALQRWAAVSGE